MADEPPSRRSCTPPDPAISEVRCRVYEVPTDQPEADGTLAWSSTTVVLVQVVAGGTTGTGWTYASGGCRDVVANNLAAVMTGADPMDVPGITESMVRACRNLGRPGLASCAVSAADTALWDLKARLLGQSLPGLFGRCRRDVPVYGSGGFTTYSDATTRTQLEGWIGELGIARVKIKVGQSWGREPRRDLGRVALARSVVGEDVEVFVDANGAYSAKQAIRIGERFAAEHSVTWFEEPVSSDDLAGLRQVRDQIAPDVAAGEYGYDETYFARMIAAGAVDCLQVDVTRCGGYTCWLRAAALAAAHGLQVSAHCAPARLAEVAGTVPNLRHVDYFHDHARLEAMLFDGVLTPVGGALLPEASRPGHGYTLKEADAEPYRVA
ncbi:MAG: enolase C-terminal domain-like protein [Acidimicrobiales bacterium]